MTDASAFEILKGLFHSVVGAYQSSVHDLWVEDLRRFCVLTGTPIRTKPFRNFGRRQSYPHDLISYIEVNGSEEARILLNAVRTTIIIEDADSEHRRWNAIRKAATTPMLERTFHDQLFPRLKV